MATGNLTRSQLDGRPSDNPVVWVFSLTDPDQLLIDFADAVRAAGAAVFGPVSQVPDRPVDTVIVAIPADGADGDHLDRVLEPWRDRLVPLSLAASSSRTAFNELSQLVLGRVGVERAVERALLVARVGGPTLAELYRLEASASRWERAGRPVALLLHGSGVDTAEACLARSAAAGVSTDLLREFVTVSLTRSRRRFRRNAAVGAVAALVLVAASVIAMITRHSANVATGRARTEHAHAESVRLAGLASGMIGVDPDLPWLLVRQALDDAPTTEALTAARRILYTTPVHRTIHLDGLPSYFSTDPESGRVAVTFTDGRTEVLATPSGSILLSLPAPSGTQNHVNAIAPGGHALFNAPAFVMVPGNTPLMALAAGDQFAGWIDAKRALIARDHQLAVLDVTTGSAKPTGVKVGTLRAWAESSDGSVADVISDGRLVSLDVASGLALPPVDVGDVDDLAASADGSRVFVARLNGDSSEYMRGVASLTRSDVAGHGSGVVWAQAGWVLRDQVGQLESIAPGRPTLKFSYVAHRGPITGVGPLANDAMASVGGDSDLRIWTAPPEPLRYPSRGYTGDFTDVTKYFAPFRRETVRPMILSDAATGELTYSLISPVQVGVADGQTLARRGKDVGLGDITAAARPAGDGRVLDVTDTGKSAVIDVPTDSIVWTRKDDAFKGLSLGLTAVSPDGRRVALATPFKLTSWTATGAIGSVTFASEDAPVGVMIDSQGKASVVGASGMWYRIGQRSTPLNLPGGGAAAANLAPDGDLFVVSKSGALIRYHNGRPTTVATLAPSLDVYAMRFSPDGTRVALIGGTTSEVLELGTRRVLLDLPENGEDGSIVRDIALTDTVAWTIRADGAVTRVALLDDGAVATAVTRDAPRSLTATERASLATATRTIGRS